MNKKPQKASMNIVDGGEIGVEDALNAAVGAALTPTVPPVTDLPTHGSAGLDSFGDGELDLNDILKGAPAGGPPKPPMNTFVATAGFDAAGPPEPHENWGDCRPLDLEHLFFSTATFTRSYGVRIATQMVDIRKVGGHKLASESSLANHVRYLTGPTKPSRLVPPWEWTVASSTSLILML